MKKLIRNSASCLYCGDNLVSTHVHDFVSCGCYRYSEKVMHQFKEANPEATHRDLCRFSDKIFTGIFIDGGLIYVHAGGNLDHFDDTSLYEDG